MALFYSILRDVHFMLSVICECLVEGVTKCEGEGEIQEGGSKSVSIRSCYDAD